MITLPRLALAASFLLALNAPVYAIGLTGTVADYGNPAPEKAAGRVITLGADSKYINVENGETVTIRVNGKAITWAFYTFPSITSFDLHTIAPQDVAAGAIRVYVADNPLYRGG
ncbi:CzcE family metal-binding protein [Massilia horti]|nr:CzcE family metal-binding protein [Massilia horti]